MPFARIITLHPEQATALSKQLQQQGFSVDLAHPDDAHSEPADLEIQFELCDQRQVLSRAAELAAQLRTDVLVFPGAVEAPPRPAPVREIVRPPETEMLPVVPQQVEQIHQPVVSQISSQPAETPAQTQPVPQDEEDFSYELPATSGNAFSNLGAELRKSFRQAGSAFSDTKKDFTPMLARTRESLRNAFSGLRSKASSTTETVAGSAKEYQERLKLRAAEARAAREQRLAEVERQRAEARRQAATLEQERQKERELDESARQQEFQRQRIEREQRLAEIERQRIEAIERAAALERERQKQRALAGDRPSPEFQRVELPLAIPRKSIRPRSRTSTLHGVLTGAIAVSFLFLIGLTFANFRPHSPLPAEVIQPSVEQHVPFGAATVHGAAAQPGPALQPPVRPQPQAQTSRAAAPVATHKPQRQRRRVRSSAHRGEGDDVADDVVVRHFNTAPKSQPQHPQQAGLKRYSDM